MASQQKLLRIFRLIRLLNTRPYKTVPQLSTILETTGRSVYRYLDFLEEVGYLIDKDEQHRYFIMHEADGKRDSLLDPDEAYYIQDTLQQVAPDHPLVEQITAKLNKIQTQIPNAQNLASVQAYQNVQKLSKAIALGRRVWLRKYHSASSQKISDRQVEPIHFDEDFTYLIAFDLNTEQQRQFKIERIAAVDLSEVPIQHPSKAMPLDLFGFSGPQVSEVTLLLSPLAYRLLIEEVPPAKAYLEPEGQRFLLRIPVRDWRGIGRFVMGLPGEIEVITPATFLDFLKAEVKRFLF
ncbi:MAG TPA: WYL domain-containing transcriptional regulator [Saprospiraceae bacterium]|nr:WYL domain-containing transcriptional regulator [Saprospiraceae bacterium]